MPSIGPSTACGSWPQFSCRFPTGPRLHRPRRQPQECPRSWPTRRQHRSAGRRSQPHPERDRPTVPRSADSGYNLPHAGTSATLGTDATTALRPADLGRRRQTASSTAPVGRHASPRRRHRRGAHTPRRRMVLEGHAPPFHATNPLMMRHEPRPRPASTLTNTNTTPQTPGQAPASSPRHPHTTLSTSTPRQRATSSIASASHCAKHACCDS